MSRVIIVLRAISAPFQVIRRLRERGEPIRLFAESDIESFQRLRKLEILEPEVNRGMRNDFKAALDEVDEAFLTEIQKTVEDGKCDRRVLFSSLILFPISFSPPPLLYLYHSHDCVLGVNNFAVH